MTTVVVTEAMSQGDEHGHDMVMPGFRFHPTEEELVEFYLRSKVEGKRFVVDLITFLNLYRYDPWELPALATIGEKEWFFYVPRDRKYRNGDRPNRVTTSGYWKATGADRIIRAENFWPIGLKKTLVFYIGKAPKGIRTSWIMNEYRLLPQHETETLQKAETSLCRVYKRPGVEDNPSVPRSLPTREPSSSSLQTEGRMSEETSGSSSTDMAPAPLTSTPMEDNRLFTFPPFLQPSFSADDDFHRLINYQQALMHQQQQYVQNNNNDNNSHPFQISTLRPQTQSLALNTMQGSLQATDCGIGIRSMRQAKNA